MNREPRFQIGPWEVRPTHGTITGPAGTVHLEPKPYRTDFGAEVRANGLDALIERLETTKVHRLRRIAADRDRLQRSASRRLRHIHQDNQRC